MIETIGITAIFESLKKIVDAFLGVQNAVAAKREKMRRAIAETCEVLDMTLTDMRQHIGGIIRLLETPEDDGAYEARITEAQRALSEIADQQKWQERFRAFYLCEPLDSLHQEMRDDVIESLALNNPEELRASLSGFLDYERMAAAWVNQILKNLSTFAPSLRISGRVDKSSITSTIAVLRSCKAEIDTHRQKFIDLELRLKEL